MITIPLSYLRPPLTTNRLPRNHAHRQRVVNQIQEEVGWRVKVLRARKRAELVGTHVRDPDPWPISHPVEVCLVWVVTDNRVRDADSAEPTKKAAQDALVKARVLADDRHEIVVRSYCRIEKGSEFGMRLEISDVTPAIFSDSASRNSENPGGPAMKGDPR